MISFFNAWNVYTDACSFNLKNLSCAGYVVMNKDDIILNDCKLFSNADIYDAEHYSIFMGIRAIIEDCGFMRDDKFINIFTDQMHSIDVLNGKLSYDELLASKVYKSEIVKNIMSTIYVNGIHMRFTYVPSHCKSIEKFNDKYTIGNNTNVCLPEPVVERMIEGNRLVDKCVYEYSQRFFNEFRHVNLKSLRLPPAAARHNFTKRTYRIYRELVSE